MAKRKSGGTKDPEPESSTTAAEPSAAPGPPEDLTGRQVVTLILTTPERIEADEGMNSRRYGSGEVDEMVASLLEDGQEQPVKIRANPEGSAKPYSLVFGYRRHKAALQINRDNLLGDKRFMLRAEVVDIGDKSAFLANVVENENRRDLSPIEQAYAMDRLIAEFGMTQADAAGKFHVSKATVSQRLKLLEAPEDVKRNLHEGNISVDAVLAAMRDPEGTPSRTARMAVIAAATPDQEVTANDVRRAGTAEDWEPPDNIGGAPGEEALPLAHNLGPSDARFREAAPRTYTRKLRVVKEILADFEKLAMAWDKERGEGPYYAKFAVSMVEYLQGRIGFRKIQKLLEEKA